VVITTTFIGYLTGGLARAIVTTVAILTTIYLGVVIRPAVHPPRANRQIERPLSARPPAPTLRARRALTIRTANPQR